MNERYTDRAGTLHVITRCEVCGAITRCGTCPGYGDGERVCAACRIAELRATASALKEASEILASMINVAVSRQVAETTMFARRLLVKTETKA